ncbi:MAG TPA: porin [Micropepsaceae bacterium]|nr:porin [Micropepsaceae bacterium]HRK70042.1 porin [Micropepsaceae bacterium]
MKTRLLASAALIALAAASAGAAEKVKISLGGYMNATVFNTSQDTSGFGANSSLRELGFTSEGEIHFKGKTALDDGTEVGMRVELEIEADNSSGGQSANNDIIDEVYVYVQSNWGRVEFGQQDGVADQMGVFAPNVFKTTKVDDAETFFIQDGSQNPYRPNSLRLRTDLFVSDDNVKLIYFTPRFSGFQFGISYMPEPTKNFTGFAARKDNDSNQQADIWEFGASFKDSIGVVDVNASLVYLTGTNEAPSAANRDDLEEWGFGASFFYEGFTVGGSYRFSNARGGSSLTTVLTDGSDTEIWSIGATYKSGDWTFGLQYVDGVTELDTLGNEQDGQGFEAALKYTISDGIAIGAGYQNYSYESDLSALASGGDLEADILYSNFELEM